MSKSDNNNHLMEDEGSYDHLKDYHADGINFHTSMISAYGEILKNVAPSPEGKSFHVRHLEQTIDAHIKAYNAHKTALKSVLKSEGYTTPESIHAQRQTSEAVSCDQNYIQHRDGGSF